MREKEKEKREKREREGEKKRGKERTGDIFLSDKKIVCSNCLMDFHSNPPAEPGATPGRQSRRNPPQWDRDGKSVKNITDEHLRYTIAQKCVFYDISEFVSALCY